jgi:uncharacterized protein DUF4236
VGLRFQRTFSLLGGLARLSVSKSGLGLSLGPRAAAAVVADHPGNFGQVNMLRITVLPALLLVATDASAQYQNRTYYGPSGVVTGRSTTSSSGQTTFYGPNGSVNWPRCSK